MIMYNPCPITLTKAQLYQKVMKLEELLKDSNPTRQQRINDIIAELRYAARNRVTPIASQFRCAGRPVVPNPKPIRGRR